MTGAHLPEYNKKHKSRFRYLLLVVLIGVLPVLSYFIYDLSQGVLNPCESLFRQTQLSLSSKISWLKNAGDIQLKPEKLQELSERAQFVALNLKSCCLVLDSGKINAEEFLQCKSSAFNYEQGVDKVIANIKQQQNAATVHSDKQDSATELSQLVSQLTENSKQFNQKIMTIKKDYQYKKLTAETSQQMDIENQETEPNDTLLIPNRMPLNSWVQSEISSGSAADADYFVFQSPATYRDFIRIELQNRSTTLAPRIELFDANKTSLFALDNSTAGGNIEKVFLVAPESNYYLQVRQYYGTATGQYWLRVIPLKTYDEFEPNESILVARKIPWNKPIIANIMDNRDLDFYQLQAPQDGTAVLKLDNLSTTLAPRILLFDENKSLIFNRSRDTAGANMSENLKVIKGKAYYLQVTVHYSGYGKYQLTATF
jgi:hypothetical protein